ncbi:MAG: S46 family peptidase, partial [Isosphaeraceae bacterium]|nr:S46 family peptidase [Isosphaeraceae bacterium]
YTDVRLVFAPEFDIAFFGGDPDNFEYPRYDLDVCFFRAYEDGKPAQVEHYLKWSPRGSKEGELVFVAGHPGRTSRLNTVAHLEYLRDVGFPLSLSLLKNREEHLLAYSKKGNEQARQAKEDLFGVQNSRKARLGGLAGLKDESFMERKRQAERALRDRIEADPRKKAKYGAAWDKIAQSVRVQAELAKPYLFLEQGFAFDSRLFQIARTLVRLAVESGKPNAERLREYGDAARASLEQQLYSEAPIYPEFETAKLANSLAFWKEQMGPDDPIVQRVLRGRAPEQVAAELVKGSKLADVSVRKKLAEGGLKAIESSDDPMIKLALAVDADARAVRKRREDEVEGVQTSQYALIARALFEDQGTSTYPDATFTLRLAFGTVKGYEQHGQEIPPYTTIGGAFEHAARHGNQPPYELPKSWIEAKQERRLRLDTPLNFVSTADIIGGNSGSPVVNQDGEVVGLIFDGNIYSLVLDFGYDDKLARAVAVDSRGIIEALRSIYRAESLLQELTGR